ncbi:MAG: NAD-dependent epimerase/dehydratase family protein [Pseudomonadales bacterium]|nr:NAD-dependent epimerase/dehydratase family protein [Pseudomonadales bacterium]
MKTLVTGGSGFLGRYIVEQLLAKGYQVSVLFRGEYPELEGLPIQIFRGDVTNIADVMAAVIGNQMVFHVAAKVGYWGRYRDFYRVNVSGTENIIQACEDLDVKKLIYTSSPSVTMNNIDIYNGDESLPYPSSYHSHYSATKAIAERRVLAAHSQSLHTVVIRPHLIVGPRDNHLLPRLLEKARLGKLKQIGPGTNRVSVSYVENAAHAHILAAESENTGGKAYFINEPEPVLLWPWLKDILQQLGEKPPNVSVPFRLAYGAGFILEQCYSLMGIESEPMVTRFIASELYRNHFFSIKRAQQDFNYQPLYSFSEAQEKTLRYEKQRVQRAQYA